jgi:plastocyanin
MRNLIFIAALATLACGDDGPSDPGDGNGDALTVDVVNNDFNPSTLTVPVNSSITWQWNSGGVAHNVTFEDGVASTNLTSGTYLRSFSAAGTYNYICTLHVAEGMAGTVTVSASSTGETGGGTGGGGTGGGGYP